VARKKVIHGDNVVGAVKAGDKPFATVTDIAAYLDVSSQGVRNNYDELREYDGLEWGKVGQATVFWLPEDGTPAQVEETSSPPEPPEQSQERTQDRNVSGESKGILQRLFASQVGDQDKSDSVGIETPENNTLSRWSNRLRKLSIGLVAGDFLAALLVVSFSPGSPLQALSLFEASVLMILLALVGVAAVLTLAGSKALQEAAQALPETGHIQAPNESETRA